MLSKRGILRLSIVLAIIFWGMFTSMNILSLDGLWMNMSIPYLIRGFCFSFFILSVFIFFRFEIKDNNNVSGFNELLWKTFVTSSFALLMLLLVKLFFKLIGNNAYWESKIVVNFTYHFVIGFFVLFLANTFYVYKKLVLYQKTRILNRLWNYFEGFVILLIFINFTKNGITNAWFESILWFIIFGSLALSVNLKWVAYLSFKQKWQSILLLLLIFAIGITFFEFFYSHTIANDVIFDLNNNLFILSSFSFIMIYSLISLLVLLFNLPTSSVFEKKFEEVLNFQKITQSVQFGDDENQVCNILFEGSMNTVQAQFGWLEIQDERGNITNLIMSNMNRELVFETKTILRKNGHSTSTISTLHIKDIHTLRFSEIFKKYHFKSIILLPIATLQKKFGILVLIKDVKDGFDIDMINIIETYVNQASVSIENLRLLSTALLTERYKQELTIATRVQQSLLPKELPVNDCFKIGAFSYSAAEVGGDFYDFYNLSGKRYAVVIGDVSGNGTSAAFHMAQMKGVFQSLIQLDLPPERFMVCANKALSNCLDKTSFITLTLLIVDSFQKRISITRAGHCPTIIYEVKNKTSIEILGRGLALGILRNDTYKNFVSNEIISYQTGDLVFLYTDGVLEAKNQDRKEFGIEKIKEIIQDNFENEPSEIINTFNNTIKDFVGTTNVDDDYTMVVLKLL